MWSTALLIWLPSPGAIGRARWSGASQKVIWRVARRPRRPPGARWRRRLAVTGRVIRLLCTIDYWFSGPRARIHKTVHHFLLEYIEGEITVENDPDQEAEDAALVRIGGGRDAVGLFQ